MRGKVRQGAVRSRAGSVRSCAYIMKAEVLYLRSIDLRDVSLLAELVKGEHVSKIKGLTLRDFSLDRDTDTIYRRLRFLISLGYVGRGFQITRADTYYITPEGINFYEEAIS